MVERTHISHWCWTNEGTRSVRSVSCLVSSLQFVCGTMRAWSHGLACDYTPQFDVIFHWHRRVWQRLSLSEMKPICARGSSVAIIEARYRSSAMPRGRTHRANGTLGRRETVESRCRHWEESYPSERSASGGHAQHLGRVSRISSFLVVDEHRVETDIRSE